MKWEPAVYEHKAALFNLSSAAVANSVNRCRSAWKMAMPCEYLNLPRSLSKCGAAV